MWLALAAVVTCILSTLILMISVGIGLGYNYCYVDYKTNKLDGKYLIRLIHFI